MDWVYPSLCVVDSNLDYSFFFSSHFISNFSEQFSDTVRRFMNLRASKYEAFVAVEVNLPSGAENRAVKWRRGGCEPSLNTELWAGQEERENASH